MSTTTAPRSRSLIAEDYSFTSPIDNALDRETYFAICWPNSVSMTGVDVMQGAENGEFAWIVYEGTARGKRFRNAEFHRVVGGKLVSTEVYFGWDVPHPIGAGSILTRRAPLARLESRRISREADGARHSIPVSMRQTPSFFPRRRRDAWAGRACRLAGRGEGADQGARRAGRAALPHAHDAGADRYLPLPRSRPARSICSACSKAGASSSSIASSTPPTWRTARTAPARAVHGSPTATTDAAHL